MDIIPSQFFLTSFRPACRGGRETDWSPLKPGALKSRASTVEMTVGVNWRYIIYTLPDMIAKRPAALSFRAGQHAAQASKDMGSIETLSREISCPNGMSTIEE